MSLDPQPQRPLSVVLPVAGELDMNIADDVLAEGLDCLERAGEVLVIDLAQVTFIDSTGITPLVRLRNEAIAEDKLVIVVNAQPHIRRVFEVTGLAEAFGLTAAETDAP